MQTADLDRRALAKAIGTAARVAGDIHALVAQTSVLTLTIARQGVAVEEELDLLRFHLREAMLRLAIGPPVELIETKPLPPQDSPQAPAAPSQSRSAGGHARAAKLSPKRRKAIAQAAAAVRWGKHG